MKNILIKPTKENLTSFLIIGGFLVFVSFIDVLANTFLDLNFTGFMPNKISYFSPLIIGTIGLYLIRIEFSGNKLLDKINKFAPIKYILKTKSKNNHQILEFLEDIKRDLMNYDLEFRIQELESKFSKDMSEATFNELKELKKEKNIN